MSHLKKENVVKFLKGFGNIITNRSFFQSRIDKNRDGVVCCLLFEVGFRNLSIMLQ